MAARPGCVTIKAMHALAHPRYLVAGLINLETTLRVDAFPLAYNSQNFPFFGVGSSVSGVGYNIARALKVLGDEFDFLALIGQDPPAGLVRQALAQDAIPSAGVLTLLRETPQSVILYDPSGRRQNHTDLKDIQDQAYPPGLFQAALQSCDIAVLCNINFNRPFLQAARQAGKPVATDVHALYWLFDDYNRDFIAAADILFLSHDNLPEPPEDFARHLLERWHPAVLVVGLGSQGALLVHEGQLQRVPAVQTRPVVNTIGAGDALFSAFLHAYPRLGDPYEALRRATFFASWKIGERSASQGFPSLEEWQQLYA